MIMNDKSKRIDHGNGLQKSSSTLGFVFIGYGPSWVFSCEA